jgi:integrase
MNIVESKHPEIPAAPQEKTLMRRRRFQKGSLQKRKQGKRRVWVVLYYDENRERRFHAIGPASELSKGDAEQRQQEFMKAINGGPTWETARPPLLREFLNEVYLPFYRGKWKESTRGTTENRIQHHILRDLGGNRMDSFTPVPLQQYLDGKAAIGLSRSMVKHLRWDLQSIFRLAVAERLMPTNPAVALYCPQMSAPTETRAMTAEEFNAAAEAFDIRERVILYLGCLAGMRPGELLALQRGDFGPACRTAEVRRRVYRGRLNVPKNGKFRTVAVPEQTAQIVADWLDKAVEQKPGAFVFAGETGQPLWRDSLLEDHFRPRLKPLGLDWVDFQVMRATHASLGKAAGADVKVQSDQRGHGLGVAMEVYTRSSIGQKSAAAKKLERSVLDRVRPIRKRA